MTESEPVLLSDVAKDLSRRWRLMLAISLSGAAIAAVIAWMQPPEHRAVTRLLIAPADMRAFDADAWLSRTPNDGFSIVEEIEVLRSRGFGDAVRERLADDPAYASTSVDALLRRVDVSRVGATSVVEIVVAAPTPPAALRVANAWADSYIAQRRQLDLEAARAATAWLEGQLETLRQDVAAAETAVERFRADNALFDVQGDTLTERELLRVTSELVAAQAELEAERAKLQRLRDIRAQGGDLLSSPEAEASRSVADLRRSRIELRARAAEIAARYGPRHPALIEAERELSELDDELAIEIDRIFLVVENRVIAAQSRVAALEARIGVLNARAARDAEAVSALRELQREAEARQSVYQQYLLRHQNSIAAADFQLPAARILSPAGLQGAASREPLLIVVAGTLLALTAGAGTALAAERATGRVRSPDDLELMFQVPTARVTNSEPKAAGRAVAAAVLESDARIALLLSLDGREPLDAIAGEAAEALREVGRSTLVLDARIDDAHSQAEGSRLTVEDALFELARAEQDVVMCCGGPITVDANALTMARKAEVTLVFCLGSALRRDVRSGCARLVAAQASIDQAFLLAG